MSWSTSARALSVRLNIHDLAKPGAIVFCGLMISNVFHYLYYMLVSRVVDVAQYGIVTSLLAASLLLAAPSTVGSTAIAKLAADLHAIGDQRQLRKLADIVDAAAVGVALLALVLASIFVRPLAAFFHLDSIVPIFLLGVILALFLVLPAQRAVLQGRHSFGAFAGSALIEAVGKSALGPLAAIRFGAVGALGGLAVGLLCAAIFNAVAMRFGTAAAGVALTMRVRDFVALAAKAVSALLAINMLLYYDTMLVRHFFDANTAGLYGAANLVGRAIYAALGFVPIVLLPKAAERLAKGVRATSLLLAGTAVIGVGGAIALIACALAPGTIVRLIAGPAYVAAAPFILPYAVASVALAGANAVACFRIGLRRFEHAVPLALVAIAEVTVVAVHHGRVQDVLMAVVVGNVLAFACTFYRLGPHLRTSKLSAA